MFDAKLLFADKKDIKGATTDCDVIDLGQESHDDAVEGRIYPEGHL